MPPVATTSFLPSYDVSRGHGILRGHDVLRGHVLCGDLNVRRVRSRHPCHAVLRGYNELHGNLLSKMVKGSLRQDSDD